MKRLFVSAAVLPLALASAAQAETKITTAVTTPLRTSTAANGAPDDLTIDTTGSVKPAAAGAAVTLDSSNTVKNAGTIGFTNVDNATGILALGGHTGAVINTGAILVTEDTTQADTNNDGLPDGPFATGANRFGIHVTGPGTFTGDVRNDAGGSITVKGETSGGLVVDTFLAGNLTNAGSVAVTGDHSVGVSAQHVTGNVKILGAVGATGEGSVGVSLTDVDGAVVLQNAISATGYKATNRLSDADRAKLSASELFQGGPAVRIAGSVGHGVLLDKPPTDNDTNNADEDNDGIPDASEGTAALTSFGAAPALDIGAPDHAISLGVVGTGDNAYALVNRGTVTGQGVNDGVAATAIRIGQAGGGPTTLTGGINNQGAIVAAAFGADVTAQGGDATGILINAGASVPALKNSGTISASLANGSQNAWAVRDLSGSLARVDNTGTIVATVAAKTGSTNVGQAVALDLSANTTGAVVTQANPSATATASITGAIRFGSGADQLLVSGGTITGDIAFGAGADVLRIDNGAVVSGAISDSDGALGVQVQAGKLAMTNVSTLNVSSLTVGPQGEVSFTLDPAHNTNTRFNVAGGALLSDGAKLDVTLASLLKTAQTFELIHANLVTTGSTPVTLVGAPFLYTASLKRDVSSLSVDIRPKTAAELGLNRSGAQAYSAVFAALDKDPNIQSAVLAQSTQAGFQGIYDQMLPDHSGGALSSAQAISGAISQAVGQALPHDGRGGSALWAQEIAFRLDRDRDQALGFTASGYGLAAGAEMVGEAQAVGLNGSFVTTTYKDKGAAVGERVVMNFAEGGLYWRMRAGGFQADARAGLGYVWFDSDRRLDTTSLALGAKGSWNGWLVDAHAGASYALHAGRLYARPEVSLDYIRLNEDGYQEKGAGAGFDLKVDSREGDLLTGQALVAFGWEFGDESWWAPELKLGWREKLAGKAGATTARFDGGAAFTLDPEDPVSGGAVARLGIKGGSDQIFFAIDGGGTFDSGSRAYDLRGTIRFRF